MHIPLSQSLFPIQMPWKRMMVILKCLQFKSILYLNASHIPTLYTTAKNKTWLGLNKHLLMGLFWLYSIGYIYNSLRYCGVELLLRSWCVFIVVIHIYFWFRCYLEHSYQTWQWTKASLPVDLECKGYEWSLQSRSGYKHPSYFPWPVQKTMMSVCNILINVTQLWNVTVTNKVQKLEFIHLWFV